MKKVNIVLIILVSIMSLISIVLNPEDEFVFLLKDLSVILTLVVPYIFEKVFGKDLGDGLNLCG